MKVVFTIAGLHPESGGPARSVPALAEALGNSGLNVEMVSLDYGKNSGAPLLPRSDLVRTILVDCTSTFARRTQWTPKFKTMLRQRCLGGDTDILHDTGVWLMTNRAAAAVSAQIKLPRVVSPRGMLTAWAFQFKAWKKRLAWALYQRLDLLRAHALHATSQAEAQEFRALGFRQPIAVIPNGTELPRREEKSRNGAGNRTMLFLSRIHPKKGLLDLVAAWEQVRPQGWHFVIAGEDEGGHKNEVIAEIRRRGLESYFSFVGTVDGEAKWALFRQAELFVLPSHSENFGMAVAEALACEVPVITTRGTPWRELVERRCGWWTEIGVDSLAKALREAVALPDDERWEMGRRGRELVAARYTWPGVGAQMKTVYEWILKTGPKPDCMFD